VAEEEADAEVKELDESLEELSLKKKKKLPVEDENEEAGETEVEGGSGPSSAQAGEDEDDDQDDDIADDDVEMAEDSEKEDSLARKFILYYLYRLIYLLIVCLQKTKRSTSTMRIWKSPGKRTTVITLITRYSSIAIHIQ
jgi:hypothetical protein